MSTIQLPAYLFQDIIDSEILKTKFKMNTLHNIYNMSYGTTVRASAANI